MEETYGILYTTEYICHLSNKIWCSIYQLLGGQNVQLCVSPARTAQYLRYWQKNSRENFSIKYPQKTAIHNLNKQWTISWEDENISCLIKALLSYRSAVLIIKKKKYANHSFSRRDAYNTYVVLFYFATAKLLWKTWKKKKTQTPNLLS